MARRAAFEAKTAGKNNSGQNTKSTSQKIIGSLPIDPTFIDSASFRETIESIAVAIILAMIFKTLEAEAYVIPTGSMAPTLMGQHVEIECDECHYWFRTGSLDEGPSGNNQSLVTGVRCPMCHKDRLLTRSDSRIRGRLNYKPSEYDPNEESFSGDRIVVSKVEYIFRDPRRWDVIVFKYPGNGKQNYIKRLIGLPGELLALSNGDVYIRNAETQSVGNDDPDQRAKLIARKPAEKLAAIMIPVADTHYFSPTMRQAGLPPAWVPWSGALSIDEASFGDATGWAATCVEKNQWQVQAEGEQPATFELVGAEAADGQFHWLRFRNLVPSKFNWDRASDTGDGLSDSFLNSPGVPVTDYYCYSDSNEHNRDGNPLYVSDRNRIGGNWVGDLVMEADVQVSSGTGKLALEAVEGGVHFQCIIDVATGKAVLQTVSSLPDTSIQFASAGNSNQFSESQVEFDTPIQGAGDYRFRFANCDNRIYLWIDGAEIQIPGDGCYSRRGGLVPLCLKQDPADAQPLAIGSQNVKMKVNRLKVFRDLFYNDYVFDQPKDTNLAAAVDTVKDYLLNAQAWSRPGFVSLFSGLDGDSPVNWDKAFQLEQDQFFPMGDNSPSSKDARVWEVDHYVDRKMLIGKALMVYWPHTWNSPRFWPNFGRMRLIR